MKNICSIFGSYKIARHTKRKALGLILLCLTLLSLSAFGGDRFLHETTDSFWESNLVATVIGYTERRMFMGIPIPAMDREDGSSVWFYSIAPTNYAHTTFSIHSCGFNIIRAYPTNHLFVFPASVRVSQVSTETMLSGNYNDPIIPSPRVVDYCPYRTFEKLFPITDLHLQYWEQDFKINVETLEKRATEWREEQKNTEDMERRTIASNRVVHVVKTIQREQRQIEDCKKQPQYFRSRIEWLKTQGVNPEPQTTD
jgi:hypothetical protein